MRTPNQPGGALGQMWRVAKHGVGFRGGFLIWQPPARRFAHILWQDKQTGLCAMPGDSKPFVVRRNKCITPKERRIERLPSGYSIREFYNHPQGRYWYVVTALEVIPTKRRRSHRI
jgi:hypothetical protein